MARTSASNARGPSGSGGRPAKSASRSSSRDTEQAEAIHAINGALRGPVLEIYKGLLPDLAPLSYEEALAMPNVVDGCLRLFEKRRDLFADLLVTKDGQPVADDQTPLQCGRSVDDIRLLVVRTSAKKYFRTHGDRFGDVEEHRKRPQTTVNPTLLGRLFDLVSQLWHGRDSGKAAAAPKPTPKSGADRLYDAIAPYLRHDWQVALIPYYAALPMSLIPELGEGLLALRRPEDLERLLGIGRASFNEAQSITGPLAREMLDTDPRAAGGVTQAGTKEYERLLGGLYERMGRRFWAVFSGPDLLDSLRTKNTADIVEMAAHLDRMGSESVDFLVRFLQRPRIAPFLRVAEDQLGKKTFGDIFGEGGNTKLARVFAEKAAQIRADEDDDEDFTRKLTFIFEAYRASPDDFAKTL